MLKQIGQAARVEVERLLGHQVYMELWVKVRERWRRDPVMLRRLGYTSLGGE
jgi:GTP-binding protein Era